MILLLVNQGRGRERGSKRSRARSRAGSGPCDPKFDTRGHDVEIPG